MLFSDVGDNGFGGNGFGLAHQGQERGLKRIFAIGFVG
jgi:hypothetical protein